MSSLVRRIQKRIAISQGFHRSRNDTHFQRDMNGDVVNSLNYIHNSDGERAGLHWPQVSAPTRENCNA